MKFRNGFVSNSSSSSFVIVGWRDGRFKTDEDDMDEGDILISDYDDDIPNLTFDYEDSIFGIYLMNVSDYGLASADVQKLVATLKLANEIGNKYHITEQPKLFMRLSL